jgi:hypothetical protein
MKDLWKITYQVSWSVQFEALLFALSTSELILCVKSLPGQYIKLQPTHVQIILLEFKCPMDRHLQNCPLNQGQIVSVS